MTFTVKYSFGIPGDADAVNVFVGGIYGNQNVGVTAAVSIIHTGDQDGIKIFLSFQVGTEIFLGRSVLLTGDRGGDLLRGLRLHGRLLLRGLKKAGSADAGGGQNK